MSIILFFGAASVVIVVGFTLVAVTLHHHWKLSKIKPEAAGKKS